jgi:hypothetical protein
MSSSVRDITESTEAEGRDDTHQDYTVTTYCIPIINIMYFGRGSDTHTDCDWLVLATWPTCTLKFDLRPSDGHVLTDTEIQ